MNKPPVEPHNAIDETIEKMLSERQEVLVTYCRLAGLQPYSPTEDAGLLQRFCELLIDYSAFCHFEIYERLIDGREQREQVVEAARDAYPRIAEATEVAVEFNDKYDAADHTLVLDQLERDLGKVGEELAVRIEMEDRIVAALRG